MKSNLISKSETTTLLSKISEEWHMDIPRVKNLRIHQISDGSCIITGKDIKILNVGDDYIPFLSETMTLERFPKIVVDMGAIKFVCKGANIMRPGIKSFTDFDKGTIVCIAEESHQKFLAVGRSTMSSADASQIEKGEIIKNLHYISDRFWEIGKVIRDNDPAL